MVISSWSINSVNKSQFACFCTNLDDSIVVDSLLLSSRLGSDHFHVGRRPPLGGSVLLHLPNTVISQLLKTYLFEYDNGWLFRHSVWP